MSEDIQPGPNVLPAEEELRCRLVEHINRLAGEIGERNIWQYKELSAAADYITEKWREIGFEVGRQEYKSRDVEVANLEIEVPGRIHPDEILLIGAHYDSVFGSPGANDNATGVAALLEIARQLVGAEFSRTVRLVAFVNEEPPFFMQPDMGSRIYAGRCRLRNENIVAMLSLETIGYYSDTPGSQRYPFPLSFFYPDTANFIGFVGNISGRRLVNQVLAFFRKHTTFPAQRVAAPGWVMGIDWSDHWSFWREGYPALMVTDTALFRYEFYHTGEDTPDKIDYQRLAAVVAGLGNVAKEIGNSGKMF